MKRLAVPILALLLIAACSRPPGSPAESELATQATNTFSNLSATLNPDAAEFSFDVTSASQFEINLSTDPSMATDVYVAFGAGDDSPIVVLDPQARWDKYVCGATLYWQVIDRVGGDRSGIQQAPVCPVNPFTDLAAAFNEKVANFVFEYSGSGSEFTASVSTKADMSVLLGTATSTRSPIRVADPIDAFDGYACGVVLYWRVEDDLGAASPIQEKPVCGHVGFAAEDATLAADEATFAFRYRGAADNFRVDMSTLPDMSRDVYVYFGTGHDSPVVVADPRARWDKYACGATLYWRVLEQDNGVVGDIQTATVTCPSGP